MATKVEVNATVEDALADAGTTVLSHLGSRAHKLTVDEVREFEEENSLRGAPKEGEYKAYGGPYTDPNDERNAWTFAQEIGDTTRTSEQLPDYGQEDTKKKEAAPKKSTRKE